MWLQDLPEVGSGPLVVCYVALRLYAWCVALEYGSISRFKAVFSAVWGCRAGLLVLRALRGLCGFCARVELGGFMTCCVFASVFRFFSVFVLLLSFCPCVCFPWLILLPALFVLVSLGVFVFSFSLSDYTQKERAQRFLLLASSLRVLWVILV